MNTVQRTRGIRRIIRTRIMNTPAQKFITAGDSACGRMMYEARQRRIPPEKGGQEQGRQEKKPGLQFVFPSDFRSHVRKSTDKMKDVQVVFAR